MHQKQMLSDIIKLASNRELGELCIPWINEIALNMFLNVRVDTNVTIQHELCTFASIYFQWLCEHKPDN